MARQKYAIIISSGDACLKQCLDAIAPQVSRVLVIEAMGRRSIFGIATDNVTILRSENDDVNVSKWWNQGFGMVAWLVARARAQSWDVALLNENVVVPSGWFTAVAENMRDAGAVAGCSGAEGPARAFSMTPGPALGPGLDTTAFVVAGELAPRAKETLRWEYAGTFLDWESRKAGGVVVVPGFNVTRLESTGLSQLATPSLVAKDSAEFYRLYNGMLP